MVTQTLVIRGDKSDLSLSHLEAVSSQIVRAKTSGVQVEVSLGLFQRVLHDYLQMRREALSDSQEIKEIISEMESGDSLYLKVSSSRLDPCAFLPCDFSDLEITDLAQLGGDSSHDEVDPELPEMVEADEEFEGVMEAEPAIRRPILKRRGRNYWDSSLNLYRVLAISLVGFFFLAVMALLMG